MHDSDLSSSWGDDNHVGAAEILGDAAGLCGHRTWSEGLYGFAWVMVVMAPTFLLASEQWHRLDKWTATLSQPHWWAYHNDGWLWVPLGLLALAGLCVSFSSMHLTAKATTLLLVLSASVAWDCVMTRSYHVITGAEVLVQPALPWQPAFTFMLSDAAVVERGCSHDSDDMDHVIFRVRYSANGGGILDLGRGVGRRGASGWLKVMEPYVNHSIALSPESVRNVPHDSTCIDEVAADLDAGQRSTLVRLLS